MFNSLKLAVLGFAALALTACQDDATVASHNLSKAADNFEVLRKVVFYNGITDEIMYELEGRCSIEADRSDQQLETTCKIGPDEYRKDFLGLSDNVSYMVLQSQTVDTSVYHFRRTFKPQSVVPDIDFRGNAEELVTPRDTSN
jgi:hypothetical protein